MNKLKLHIGCGLRDFGPDWIHIDGNNYSHVKYNDIKKLNFDNDSVDLIYASHVIEYFDRNKVIDLLYEWKRVLKSGGILRLAVPDFESLILVYNKTNDINKILGPLYGKMEMGNNLIYHKTVYDFKSLKDILEQLGYSNIHLYDWQNTEHSHYDDHSQAYIPHMDKKNGLLISLNIECKKI